MTRVMLQLERRLRRGRHLPAAVVARRRRHAGSGRHEIAEPVILADRGEGIRRRLLPVDEVLQLRQETCLMDEQPVIGAVVDEPVQCRGDDAAPAADVRRERARPNACELRCGVWLHSG